MLKILTVCTGNVCRSPLAALVLAQRLSELDVQISSSGTRSRPGLPMTSEAQKIAVELGASPEAASTHVSRFLDTTQLRSADFVIAMARDHRRAIVELDPSLSRTTFTLRELDRLVALTDSDELVMPGKPEGLENPRAALMRMLAHVASRRGIAPPPDSPDDDDVVDPYGRSRRTYAMSGVQVARALPSVERLVRLALAT